MTDNTCRPNDDS